MTISKIALAKAMKVSAAGLINALDISELLGDELANEIIGNEELASFVERKRDALAERIRNL